MSGYDNLNKRLDYRGGRIQRDRMIQDKLDSLNKAILYSYQAATIMLATNENPFEYNREFKCLINPDKLKNDYDQKILSIPYKAIQLNSERIGKTKEGLVPTEINSGDVFYWKETDSYWLVYLQKRDEHAYFMGEIRHCKQFLEINDHKYWVYVRGPVETTIPWNQKDKKSWNDMNYTQLIYVTKNEETLDFFHRFTVVKIDGKPWEVQAVDWEGGEGIIEVQLSETFNNSIADARQEEIKNTIIVEPELPPEAPYIEGDKIIYPYDIKEYFIHNMQDGNWLISDQSKIDFVDIANRKVKIKVVTGKSGFVDLSYVYRNEVVAKLQIEIGSI